MMQIIPGSPGKAVRTVFQHTGQYRMVPGFMVIALFLMGIAPGYRTIPITVELSLMVIALFFMGTARRMPQTSQYRNTHCN